MPENFFTHFLPLKILNSCKYKYLYKLREGHLEALSCPIGALKGT